MIYLTPSQPPPPPPPQPPQPPLLLFSQLLDYKLQGQGQNNVLLLARDTEQNSVNCRVKYWPISVCPFIFILLQTRSKELKLSAVYYFRNGVESLEISASDLASSTLDQWK